MGHYCRFCNRSKPNESFSGKGHKVHICRDCFKIPKKEREIIEQQEELFRFLKQSHISKKNKRRLNDLSQSEDSTIREYANIIAEVAQVKPHKKRRLKVLAKERRDLLQRLEETGLIWAHYS